MVATVLPLISIGGFGQRATTPHPVRLLYAGRFVVYAHRLRGSCFQARCIGVSRSTRPQLLYD